MIKFPLCFRLLVTRTCLCFSQAEVFLSSCLSGSSFLAYIGLAEVTVYSEKAGVYTVNEQMGSSHV